MLYVFSDVQKLDFKVYGGIGLRGQKEGKEGTKEGDQGDYRKVTHM